MLMTFPPSTMYDNIVSTFELRFFNTSIVNSNTECFLKKFYTSIIKQVLH